MSVRSTRIGGLTTLTVLSLMAAGTAGQDRPAAAHGQPVFNPVDGRIRVLSCRPDGDRVEKGEVVCELNPAELKDRIAAQELAVQAARAGLQGARLAREAAAIELNAYRERGLPRDISAAEAAVKAAQSNMVRQEDQYEWANRMFDKGYLSKAEKVREELGLEKARLSLEQVQANRQVQLGFVKEKATKLLMSAVEIAREHELAREAELKRAEAVLKSLHDQIAGCRVAAPVAGRIAYETTIGPGAVIGDGQVLLRIVPDATTAGAGK